MKTYYTIILVCLCTYIFAQGGRSEKIKITKADFSKTAEIQALLTALPKECPVTGYQFAIDTPELTKTISIKNNQVTSDLKSIVKDMKAGQVFYIENIKSNCKVSFKTKYIFVVA